MARYFAGNSLASFWRTNIATLESTTSGTFDSSFVANSIALGSGGATTTDFSATGTVWSHFEFYSAGTDASSGDVWASWKNGSADVFRIAVGGSGFQCQYWSGSAWVNAGSSFAQNPGARDRFDVKLTLNTSFELYKAGTLVTSGSISGATTMTKINFGPLPGAGGQYISQVMVADFDTRDSRLLAAALNGNSAANTGGSGSYTDVNETVLDDSTAISIATSGNKMGQTHAGITVPGGYVIGAMCLGARGRVNGTITDGKVGIRSGGSNYSSSGLVYNSGYEPRTYIAENDPATATRFTQSGFNAAETYLEAA